MNILFLMVSVPQLSNRNGLFPSLIQEFNRHGHKVLVSTKGKDDGGTKVETEDGIPVLRISGPEFTGISNNVKKALAYQEYVLKQRYYIMKYWRHEEVDLIISHSLPPELAFVVGGLKRHYGCELFLLQTDFTWQDAVAYGYFRKNGPIGLYYRFWEKKIFKQSDYIGVPTKGNVSYIRRLYPWIDETKFSVIPFWQRNNPVTKNMEFKFSYGLDGKFVVIYGGSVGAAQRIEHFVELAEECSEYEDMLFLLVGKGAYLSVIKNLVEEKQLSNVIFRDFVPQQEYLQLLAVCDVGLIILNEKMATPNFPSKSLSYFNARVPVLAAIDHVTDFGEYLEENKAGLWGFSDDRDGLKSQLLKYYHSKELREETASNAYDLFVNNMTPEHAYLNICKHLCI